jgi:hypothetical protein
LVFGAFGLSFGAIENGKSRFSSYNNMTLTRMLQLCMMRSIVGRGANAAQGWHDSMVRVNERLEIVFLRQPINHGETNLPKDTFMWQCA